MYKVKKGLAPEIFFDYFTSNSLFHDHDTRSNRQLRIPRFQRDIMKQSIRVKGVYCWNFISNNLTSDCSLLSFKSNLRKLLRGSNILTNIVP